MNSQSFPIGISGQWSKADNLIIPNAHLKSWLMDTGSLTERLQSVCRRFEVDVIGHDTAEITPEEGSCLYGEGETALEQTQVREVMLRGDDNEWVFARSLMPQVFIDTCMHELATLGNQPLGKILFNDPRFKRQVFEIMQCDIGHHLFNALNLSTAHPIWGRRSLFHFQSHRIMVCEMFLPSSPAYRDLELNNAK